MPTVKRIICLANSRKLSGRCVAGKMLLGAQPAEWIRPVSERENQEVSEYERQYEDGSDPQVMDIMDVPLIKPLPSEYQQENWLLNPEYYWKKVGRAAWPDLQPLVDSDADLWINNHSTFSGQNDKIPLPEATALEDSLRLIHMESVALSVFKPGAKFGNDKRRVQGRFQYCGVEYGLWITDPGYERAYLKKPDGTYTIGESYLAISIGEPFNDYCYKFIASVIERNTETE